MVWCFKENLNFRHMPENLHPCCYKQVYTMHLIVVRGLFDKYLEICNKQVNFRNFVLKFVHFMCLPHINTYSQMLFLISRKMCTAHGGARTRDPRLHCHVLNWLSQRNVPPCSIAFYIITFCQPIFLCFL